MPTDLEEEPHDTLQEEEGGGPIKSFLEHLEDLRWVLIKCGAVIGVCMIVCLIGANQVVEILKYPLKKAQIRKHTTGYSLAMRLGTNHLGSFSFPTNVLGNFDLGTSKHTIWHVEPLTVGTNIMLGIRAAPATEAEADEDDLMVKLINLSPAAAFFVAFKVAFYAGIVFSSPLLFYFIGGFVFPALKIHEKKYVYQGMAIGGTLFLMGVGFCFFVLMPIALRVSAQYSQWLGFSAEMWRAEEYIGFVCKFMLGMGLGFELPVVLLTLVKIGIIDYRMLKSFRRYMIVVNLILGAILTTPEVVTQLCMFVPLQLLYEISVLIAWYWERQDRKKAELNREL